MTSLKHNLHHHALHRETNNNWTCDGSAREGGCRGQQGNVRYHCSICDFDICPKCAADPNASLGNEKGLVFQCMVKSLLDEDLKFKANPNSRIHLMFDSIHVIGKWGDKFVLWYVQQTDPVPEATRVTVAKALCKLNRVKKIGNWEMDMNDGECRFKVCIPIATITETLPEICKNAMVLARGQYDSDGPGIRGLAAGQAPVVIKQTGYDGVIQAVRASDLDRLRELVGPGAPGNVNAVNDDGISALHIAAHQNLLPVVKRLLEYRADVDVKTKAQAATPLHLAAHQGHSDIVVALAPAAKNIDGTDKFGDSPLIDAVRKCNADAVQTLLAHGANKALTNNDGVSPLVAALKRNDPDITRVLTSSWSCSHCTYANKSDASKCAICKRPK